MSNQKTARPKAAAGKASQVFSDVEKAAMRESAKERKAQARRGKGDDRAEGERDVLAKIAEMPGSDREIAERLHAIITATVPDLVPRTYYGMPAYAKDGKVICFFQAASKFKVRHATFGFQPDANLDDGTMWPTAFALTKLTAADEAKIAKLVKQAVS